MKTEQKEKHLQKQSLVIKERLSEIKNFIDNNNVKSITSVRSIGKGSAMLYSILTSKNILLKINNYYKWNDKIPITIQLSYTLSKDLFNYNVNKSKVNIIKEEDIIEEKLSLKDYVKSIIINGDKNSKEYYMALNYVKYNFDLWMSVPKDCYTSYNSFGVSIFPDVFKRGEHDSIKVRYIDNNGNMSMHRLLPHQLYAHDILIKKWLNKSLKRVEIEPYKRNNDFTTIEFS